MASSFELSVSASPVSNCDAVCNFGSESESNSRSAVWTLGGAKSIGEFISSCSDSKCPGIGSVAADKSSSEILGRGESTADSDDPFSEETSGSSTKTSNGTSSFGLSGEE